MFRYIPPTGYRLPNQAYSRFGYDGNLWLPAKYGKNSGVMPSVSGGFSGDFSALAVSFGLTVVADWDPTRGVSGTQGAGKSLWVPRAGLASNMVPASGSTDGIGTLGAGLAGKASMIANSGGHVQSGNYTVTGAAAPATNNFHYWAIGRFNAYTSNTWLWADSSLALGALQQSVASNIEQYNQGASGAITTGVVLNQWYAIRESFLGVASGDRLRVGAHIAPTSAIFSNNVPTAGRTLFDVGTGGSRSAFEILRLLCLTGPYANYQAFDASASPKAQSYWSNAIEI